AGPLIVPVSVAGLPCAAEVVMLTLLRVGTRFRTTTEKLVVVATPSESVARAVKESVPVAMGVPLIETLDAFCTTLRPGTVLVIVPSDQVRVPVPPVGAMV